VQAVPSWRKLNDGRFLMGDGRQLEGEIRKLCEVRGRRFRVALLPTEIPGSRDPGLRLNPQWAAFWPNAGGADEAPKLRMSGSYFFSMTCCAIPRRYGI